MISGSFPIGPAIRSVNRSIEYLERDRGTYAQDTYDRAEALFKAQKPRLMAWKQPKSVEEQFAILRGAPRYEVIMRNYSIRERFLRDFLIQPIELERQGIALVALDGKHLRAITDEQVRTRKERGDVTTTNYNQDL